MRIIAVDDEAYALEALEEAVAEAASEASLHCFSTAADALAFARSATVDVAFLDIRLPETHGLSLALKLKDIYPHTNIVFVTGYGQYAADAFSMHASGYVRKPVNARAVQNEIENLRHFPAISASQGVYIQ